MKHLSSYLAVLVFAIAFMASCNKNKLNPLSPATTRLTAYLDSVQHYNDSVQHYSDSVHHFLDSLHIADSTWHYYLDKMRGTKVWNGRSWYPTPEAVYTTITDTILTIDYAYTDTSLIPKIGTTVFPRSNFSVRMEGNKVIFQAYGFDAYLGGYYYHMLTYYKDTQAITYYYSIGLNYTSGVSLHTP